MSKGGAAPRSPRKRNVTPRENRARKTGDALTRKPHAFPGHNGRLTGTWFAFTLRAHGGRSIVKQLRRLPIGAEIIPGEGVHFRVWAPDHRRVDVVLEQGATETRS